MKTTIDIADDLLLRAKQVSMDRHVTLREVVSEGLMLVLQSQSARKPFRVKPVTVAGKGLAPEFRHAPWSVFRGAAYEGRGS